MINQGKKTKDVRSFHSSAIICLTTQRHIREDLNPSALFVLSIVIFFYLNMNKKNVSLPFIWQSVIYDGKHTGTIMKDMENYSSFVFQIWGFM
jgi:hypothetical protein